MSKEAAYTAMADAVETVERDGRKEKTDGGEFYKGAAEGN